MTDWLIEYPKISASDSQWAAYARKRLREQTRPQGSLGTLETFLERLSAIQKNRRLDIGRKRILIFAADHGIAEEGVSLYPSEVTRAMVLNFLSGGATINALARHLQAEVRVIDVGVRGDFSTGGGSASGGDKPSALVDRKMIHGTKNFSKEPAMTAQELEHAIRAGWEMAEEAHHDGIQILALGEMGIANTTAASAVIAALTEQPVASVTGRGTGLDEAMLQHKIDVIEKALKFHESALAGGALKILQHVGGLEIAAMTGAILGAARFGIPVVVDGWIVSSSALAAVELNARVLDYLFFAHESSEAGHRFLLERLEVRPLLNLSMRLGEASGAALALEILSAAVQIYNEVATFQEAGVADRVR